MYRYFFIAKNNIKKQKSDMITFFILSTIASLFIFISLSFLTGTLKVIDTNMEKINGADILVYSNNNEQAVAKLEEIIKGKVYLKNCEKEKYLDVYGRYRHKGDDDWINYPLAICSYEEKIKIQTLSIDATGLKENDIVLPMSFSTSFNLGDIIQIKIGDNIYDFKVAEFNEDNFYCSPMNLGTYKIYVSDKMYEELRFENPLDVSDYIFLKTQLTDTAKKKNIDTNALSDDITDEFLNWYNEYTKIHPDAGISLNVLPATIMNSSSMILPFIFIALVLLFAIIMLVIAIVIIDFSVKNFIMTNMKNTAIMEATGYTVKELVLILLCQLIMVAGAGSIVGVVIGALSLNKIAILILITLGLKWNQPISIACILYVVIGIILIVGVLTVALGKEYSKTSVLDALRGGVNTHNYKKNHFAFDKTSMPIAITLALKDTFGKFKNQIGVVFIMMILAISTIVAFGMVDSFGDDDGVINVSGIDICDAQCNGSEAMENVIASMSTVDNTRREIGMVNKFSNKKITQSFSTRALTDTSNVRGGTVIEGRWPIHPNEVMFASNAAMKLGVGVGDTVTVKTDMAEESFIVCGVCQSMNNMGMMAYLTMEGNSKLNAIPDMNMICINFKPGVTYEQFKKEFDEAYPDEECIDYKMAAHQSAGMISLGIKAFAILVAILTILIVAFVESLIVRTNINRQWRNLGVSKALGFTSKQLIVQVMMSNMPAILIGILAGLVVSPVAGTKLMTTVFFVFGFKKVDFGIRPVSYVATAIVIVGVAMMTAALKGRKIKTLEPVKMIMEE